MRKHPILPIVILVLLSALILFLCIRARPFLLYLGEMLLSNDAAGAINQAVNAEIEENRFTYNDFVHTDKNAAGSIISLHSDTVALHRLRVGVLNRLDDLFEELRETKYPIPVGSIVFPTCFSGIGPTLTMRLVSANTSSAEFESRFSEAGINQTRHEILLHVKMTMTVLTFLGTQTFDTEYCVTVADTILLGTVPNTILKHTDYGW